MKKTFILKSICCACLTFIFSPLVFADNGRAPNEAGPHMVGYTVMEFKDVRAVPRVVGGATVDYWPKILKSRVINDVGDVLSDDQKDRLTPNRDVRVNIWYPAHDKGGVKVRYNSNESINQEIMNDIIIPAYNQKFNQFPLFKLEYQLSAPSHLDARMNVPMKDGRYPVIVYSPGSTNFDSGAEISRMAEILASWGFIVVGLNADDGNQIFGIANGKFSSASSGIWANIILYTVPVGSLTASTPGLGLALRVGDIKFILDKLAALDAGSEPTPPTIASHFMQADAKRLSFVGHVDTNNVGVIGFSGGASTTLAIAGGSAAARITKDPRVKAIVPSSSLGLNRPSYMTAAEFSSLNNVARMLFKGDRDGTLALHSQNLNTLTGNSNKYLIDVKNTQHNAMGQLNNACLMLQDGMNKIREGIALTEIDQLFMIGALGAGNGVNGNLAGGLFGLANCSGGNPDLFYPTDYDEVIKPALVLMHANLNFGDPRQFNYVNYIKNIFFAAAFPSVPYLTFNKRNITSQPFATQEKGADTAAYYLVPFFKVYLSQDQSFAKYLTAEFAVTDPNITRLIACNNDVCKDTNTTAVTPIEDQDMLISVHGRDKSQDDFPGQGFGITGE